VPKKKPLSLLFLVCLVLCLTISGCSSGGGDATGGIYHAVIVGVSNYQVSRFNLQYGDNDALDFNQVLLTGANWDRGRMTILLNGAATKEAIRDAIFTAAGRMGPDDFFVFFFSGHGTFGPDLPPIDEADGLDEYIAPHDALESSFSLDIRDDELDNWLHSIPGANVCLIADSSFSGGLFKGTQRVKFIARPWHEEQWDGRRPDGTLKDVNWPRSIVLTASDDDESPIESPVLGNGVFTYYLVEGLEGPANVSGNSFISAEEAYGYAAPRSTAFFGGMHPQMLDSHPGQYRLIIR
jgi:uncharacterized caspase-like protein